MIMNRSSSAYVSAPISLVLLFYFYIVVGRLGNEAMHFLNTSKSFRLLCREGYADILNYLLDTDPGCWDTKSKNGRTPLHTVGMYVCNVSLVSTTM